MLLDHVLVQQASAGDRCAFDELVRRHQVRIYQLVRLMTNDDPEAEDLMQEAFVRAYRGLSTFRGDSGFGTWLHSITVNLVRTHLGRRRHELAFDDVDAIEFDLVSNVASTEDVESDVSRRVAIDRALAMLPDDLRLLVRLRDVEGLEYREICLMTGRPHGSVASGVFRARRRLRDLLAPLVALPKRAGGPSDC